MEGKKDDGGSAFPYDFNKIGGPVESGMSLRDWFAGQALTGILATNYESKTKEPASITVAAMAYHVADAMIAERAKG